MANALSEINCLTFSEPVTLPPTPILFFYLNTSLSGMLTSHGIKCDAEKTNAKKDSITVKAARKAIQSTLKSAKRRETFFKPYVVLPLTFLGSTALLITALALTTIGLPLITAYILGSIGIMLFVLSLIELIIGKYADTVKSFQDIQRRTRSLQCALQHKSPEEKILICRQKDHTFAPQTPSSETSWEQLAFSTS